MCALKSFVLVLFLIYHTHFKQQLHPPCGVVILHIQDHPPQGVYNLLPRQHSPGEERNVTSVTVYCRHEGCPVMDLCSFSCQYQYKQKATHPRFPQMFMKLKMLTGCFQSLIMFSTKLHPRGHFMYCTTNHRKCNKKTTSGCIHLYCILGTFFRRNYCELITTWSRTHTHEWRTPHGLSRHMAAARRNSCKRFILSSLCLSNYRQ